jgi:hypothetical protein
MTVPADGNMQSINTELGRASTFAFDMNDSLAKYLAHISQTVNTPWNLSSAAGAQATIALLTVGNNGAHTIYGYELGGWGSLSPASLLGAQVVTCMGGTNGYLDFSLNANVAQSFWKYLLFQTSPGVAPFLVLDSAAASYTPGGTTDWSYPPGTVPGGMGSYSSFYLTLIK